MSEKMSPIILHHNIIKLILTGLSGKDFTHEDFIQATKDAAHPNNIAYKYVHLSHLSLPLYVTNIKKKSRKGSICKFGKKKKNQQGTFNINF